MLALSIECIGGTARFIRSMAGERPAPADPANTPRWIGIIAAVLAPVLAVVDMVLMNFILATAEWLVFSRRWRPVCGAHR
ncbi:MAG: hypothetical protein ACRC1K_11855 [Planctomycetia bacterium]